MRGRGWTGRAGVVRQELRRELPCREKEREGRARARARAGPAAEGEDKKCTMQRSLSVQT